MDGSEAQLAKLKDYLEELRAEREASKEKEKREAWTKYTAVSVVFTAVLAAIAAQAGGKYATGTLKALNDATFHQAKASDQWSYFQAKSIKQALFEASRPEEAGEGSAASPKRIDTAARVARYEHEKAAIKDEATKLETQRDKAREDAGGISAKGAGMGLAVAIFQIAIAVASISMIVKKRPFWFASMAIAAVATAQMLKVFVSG